MTSAGIEDALHCHGASGQFAKVAALEALSDAIVKAPYCAPVELWMVRRAELLHDGVNLAGRNCLGICQRHDEASGFIFHKLDGLIVFNAVRHVGEVTNATANGFTQDARDVSQDVHRVLAGQLDVTGEAKILANQHAVSNADTSGESLVMAIAQAKHKLTISGVKVFASDGKAAKVTLAHASQCVLFLLDGIASAADCFAHLVNKQGVADGHEAISGIWRLDSGEFFGGDFVFSDEERHIIFRVLCFGSLSVLF